MISKESSMTSIARVRTLSHEVIGPHWSGTVRHVHLTLTRRPERNIEAGFTLRRQYVYELSCRAKRRGDVRWEVILFEIRRKTQIPLDVAMETLIAEYIVPYLAQPRLDRAFLGHVYR
jgi:hypothetical protein